MPRYRALQKCYVDDRLYDPDSPHLRGRALLFDHDGPLPPDVAVPVDSAGFDVVSEDDDPNEQQQPRGMLHKTPPKPAPKPPSTKTPEAVVARPMPKKPAAKPPKQRFKAAAAEAQDVTGELATEIDTEHPST